MDASKDLMQQTEHYIETGEVGGTRDLTKEGMTRLVISRIFAALPALDDIAPPTIGDQVSPKCNGRLPATFSSVRALKIFSINEDAWTGDPVECWFVDRGGQWYYVMYRSEGHVDSSISVSVDHLIDRTSRGETVPLWVLSSVCDKLTRFIKRGSQRLVTRAEKLSDLAAEITKTRERIRRL